jgi:hypothetical protein
MRPSKIIPVLVFPETCWKKLGGVGLDFFFFTKNLCNNAKITFKSGKLNFLFMLYKYILISGVSHMGSKRANFVH